MIRIRALVIVCLAAMAALVSCERKSDVASPSGTTADSPVGSQANASFNRGFYKEEVTPTANLRWAHQEAGLVLTVPTAGNYRLSFKPITVFTPTPTLIEVTVNGQTAGSITAQGFDFATAPASSLEAALRAGANEISLKANRADVPLGSTDARTAAFGLILPVGAEKMP